MSLSTDQVHQFSRLWSNAIATAFGGRFVRRPFSSEQPWLSPNNKERRRWEDFARLVLRLQEATVDPAEFCTAVATHFANHKHGGMFRPPTPRQVCGPYGLKVWQQWRSDRLQEAAGSSRRIVAASITSTRDRGEKLQASIRDIYNKCLREGAENVISLTWGSDILWLLRVSEPSIRPLLDELLARTDSQVDHQLRDAVIAGMNKIKATPARGAYLIHLRNQLFGIRPILASAKPGGAGRSVSASLSGWKAVAL